MDSKKVNQLAKSMSYKEQQENWL